MLWNKLCFAPMVDAVSRYPTTVEYEVLEGGEESAGEEGSRNFFDIDRSQATWV